jgi:hypothetical protein
MISNRIARLNFDGTTDTSFNPGAGLDAEGICVNLNAAGQVIAGGSFNRINGSLRSKLAVFDIYGSLIADTPTPSSTVRTLAAQTSGEVLLGGDFTTINGTTRNRIARIRPDLSLEAGFNPNALGPVHALALQTDGKILVGGNFATIGGTTRSNVARLYNGVAADRLYATTPSIIRWDRTGANEKTQRVTFEIDTGSGYGPLAGTISQSAAGWQIIPSTPLSGATNNVRATAFPSDSHSSGTHQIVASIPIVPEIEVTINNVQMEDGISTVTFPPLQVGALSTETVTISNIGLATLTLTSAVTIDGQWEIVSQPATTIASQTSVSFAIRFKPTSEGAKTGTLSIYSNDSSEGTFTVNLSGTATAGPGGLDLTWQPNANGIVRALAKSSNDSIWLGGDFTTVNASSRPRLALINKDTPPALQAQATNIIPTTVTGTVNCIAQLPDGTVLVGGQFSSKKLYWMGFAPTGEVIQKSSFDLVSAAGDTAANTFVSCMAVQADGSVLVGGRFGGIKIGTVTGSGTLIRLSFSSGVASIDRSFSAGSTDRPVRGIAIRTDGKILVCYGVSTAFSLPSEVILIDSRGVKDSSFSSSAKSVEGIALDAQGRSYVLGQFDYTGAPGQSGVGRLSSSGVLDETFTLVPSKATSLLPIVDGTLVVTSIVYGSLISPSRLQKFLSDGTADPSFISPITGSVLTVCSQEDGALLIGGSFTANAIPRTSARIINSGASTSLTVVDATRIQWLRSGTNPETQIVVFDVSQDNGATWNRFGQGQRITGGWQLTGINLPFSGILRARAYIQSAGNSSIMEDQISFSGLEVSDLNVQVPNKDTIVPDNGTAASVSAIEGSVLPVMVTLTNTGLASMTGVVATIKNPPRVGPARWAIDAQPNGTIEAGASTTAIVNFLPVSGDRGLISAELSIASSVPGLKNPYTITLVGAAISYPIAGSTIVELFASGNVRFTSSFTPNDFSATAYFRYRPISSATWINTPTTTLTGFGTAQSINRIVASLSVGVPYTVQSVITNSINVTSPVYGPLVNFTPVS